MSALDKQVGGDHYKNRGMQPVELWAALNLNGFQASIVKYITRHKEKNGAADIDKAGHFADLAVELNQPLQIPTASLERRSALLGLLERYCTQNGLSEAEDAALYYALFRGNLCYFKRVLNVIRQENGYPLPVNNHTRGD